jgi:hypothetical protein
MPKSLSFTWFVCVYEANGMSSDKLTLSLSLTHSHSLTLLFPFPFSLSPLYPFTHSLSTNSHDLDELTKYSSWPGLGERFFDPRGTSWRRQSDRRRCGSYRHSEWCLCPSGTYRDSHMELAPPPTYMCVYMCVCVCVYVWVGGCMLV